MLFKAVFLYSCDTWCHILPRTWIYKGMQIESYQRKCRYLSLEQWPQKSRIEMVGLLLLLIFILFFNYYLSAWTSKKKVCSGLKLDLKLFQGIKCIPQSERSRSTSKLFLCSTINSRLDNTTCHKGFPLTSAGSTYGDAHMP